MLTVVVDGYNVIHAVPELKRQLDRSLEAAREALAELCRDYRRRHGDVGRVCVVFDGNEAHAGALRGDRGGVTVLFTHRGEEADERILGLIRDDAGRSRFVIVSNDTRIVNNGRGLGARVMSVKTFYQQAHPAPRRVRGAPSDEADKTGLSTRDAERITEEYRKRLDRRP
jgi:predicted RNA-binding protein with PIN domain